MTIDIKNFYLATPMERYEYIKLKLSALPAEIIKEYKLLSIAMPDGSVYVEIRKGTYELPQAGKLANELLKKRLNKHGYHQSKSSQAYGHTKHDQSHSRLWSTILG